MADNNSTTQEEQYQRQLEKAREKARAQSQDKTAAQPAEKQSLFQRMGRGRFGRFGRAGMAAGMIANSQPNEPQETPDTKPDQQETQQTTQSQQANPETFFGKGAQLSERTTPYEASANQNQDKNTENNSSDKQEQTAKQPGKAAEGIATAGQVAGRTTQVAAKGAELAARGTEAISSGVSKGGQAMTRAGAELSSTGLGAIAGVPMMIAGGALTATGEAGKAASKGAQKASQSAGQFGQRVAESSKKAKQGIKEGYKVGLGENKDSSGMPYLDLARKLREEKRKLMQGDVKGIVSDAANTAGQMATARALSWAWLALIPTFGLSLIYINIHFIARYVVGSEKFCKFGEEWALKKIASEGGEGNPVEEMSQMLGKVEILGMFVLDALVITLIVLINILMDLSACFAQNPIDTTFDPASCYTNSTFSGGSSGGAGASGNF